MCVGHGHLLPTVFNSDLNCVVLFLCRNPRTHNADDFHRLVLDGLAKFAACLNPPSCACFWNDMVKSSGMGAGRKDWDNVRATA